MNLPFTKMNGAGNDFVVIDARTFPLRLKSEQVRKMAARSNAITHGCDQLIVIEPDEKADAFMRIYNADGSEVDACGNATRCVGWLIMQEKNKGNASIRTNVDTLHTEINLWGAALPGWKEAAGLVTANMGHPRLNWQDIPLSHPIDTLHVPLEIEGLRDPACVSMGNPHVVFFVQEMEALNRIERVGAALQRHPLFPKGVNVSIALVLGSPTLGAIDMRVWERGVGLTASCGTAGCAVKVAAVRRELLVADKFHTITLHNPPAQQTLMVKWDKSKDQVFLHGPVVQEFEAELEL
ncbi:MAG: diaminopimelate epimerase [Rickettsiales bacterium]|nr:diaminopimelate epimerase [Rickettsiales bacterium]